MLRACLKNISEGLAAGQGGWLRCSSVTDFANMRPRRASPSTLPRSQSPLDLFFRHALNHALQRTRPLRSGCNPPRPAGRVAGSLGDNEPSSIKRKQNETNRTSVVECDVVPFQSLVCARETAPQISLPVPVDVEIPMPPTPVKADGK